MKKYFAKYLPIEGEIEEHSMVFADGKSGVVVHVHAWPTGGYEVEFCKEKKVLTYPSKDVKLSRLFLCSRDIQVGDKIRYFENPAIEVEWTKHIDFSKSNTYTGADKPDAFKVIGEISPDAVWVTEGMEFDEDEVQRQIYDDSGYHDPWINYDEDSGVFDENYWDSEELDDKFKRVQIKCPTCKSFH